MVLDNDLVNSSVFSEYQCNFHPASQDFCLAGSLMSISVLLDCSKDVRNKIIFNLTITISLLGFYGTKNSLNIAKS